MQEVADKNLGDSPDIGYLREHCAKLEAYCEELISINQVLEVENRAAKE
jgi:hypothetical protein